MEENCINLLSAVRALTLIVDVLNDGLEGKSTTYTFVKEKLEKLKKVLEIDNV